jgi:hypothetical protein
MRCVVLCGVVGVDVDVTVTVNVENVSVMAMSPCQYRGPLHSPSSQHWKISSISDINKHPEPSFNEDNSQ